MPSTCLHYHPFPGIHGLECLDCGKVGVTRAPEIPTAEPELEVCDSCEGNGEDQAPFDYLDYLPQGGPCRFCGGRGSFPVGSYYDSRLARLVVPGDSSWRTENVA